MEYRRSSPNPYDRVSDNDSPSRLDSQQKALSAEFMWDFADDQRLTSLSAWRDWNNQALGVDATSLKLVDGDVRTHYTQFSQELRVNSRFDSADTVFGLYFLHLDINGSERAMLGSDLAQWVFGGLIREQAPFATKSNTGAALDLLIPPQTLDGTNVYTPYTQSTDSTAAFGSINWHLTDRLDLTTGLRYSYERKTAQVNRSRTGGNPSASPLFLLDNLTPLGNLIGQDLSMYTFGGLLDSVAGGTYSREDERSEGNYSGQLVANYKLTDTIITYASVSRGYKAGGINLGVIGNTLKPTFEPEIATAYEVGSKGTCFGDRLALALAVYQTNIKDYQALTFDESPGLLPNPRQTNLLNVGAVRLRGIELDGSGVIAHGLSARLGVAYSQAITTDFKNAPDEDTRRNTKDLSGERLYNAPTWSGNAGLEKSEALTDALQGYGAVDYSFRTGAYATVEHGRSSYVDGYSLTNLRLGLRHASRWEATLWVRNLFDAEYIAAVYPLYGVGDYGAFAGDPRTYGVTLRATFD
jgi:iron complex outermembrane receptor protein